MAAIEAYQVDLAPEETGVRRLDLSARKLDFAENGKIHVLLSITDVWHRGLNKAHLPASLQISPAGHWPPVPESHKCSRLKGAEIARYYFHLHDGAFIADPDGVELLDWQAASARALQRAAEAIGARGAKFWKGEHLRVVVTDAVGTALFELRLSGHLPLDQDLLGPHEPELIN